MYVCIICIAYRIREWDDLVNVVVVFCCISMPHTSATCLDVALAQTL